MVVLLDTDGIREKQRVDAIQAAYGLQIPNRTVISDRRARHRIECIDFGPGMRLLRVGGSPMQIVRTARHIQSDLTDFLAIGFHRRGHSQLSSDGIDLEMPIGQLNASDLTHPYRLTHHSDNDHEVLVISNQRAGVSVDTVRAAAPVLASSPVYELVRQHFSGLFATTRRLPTQPQLLTGQATVSLVRALLTTAAQTRDRDETMDSSLDLRICLYIDAHLPDQGLSAERIAATHHISLRHLYTTWAASDHDLSLGQWIIRRRLERARGELAATTAAIATVAHRSGFTDTSHFSRRFRETFGTSPREWRRTNSGNRPGAAVG